MTLLELYLAGAAISAQPGTADAWETAPFRNQLAVVVEFSVQRAFDDTTSKVTVAAPADLETLERETYLFRRSVTSRENGGTLYSYTSTSACPAALRPLRQFARLRMPRPHLPAFGREEGITVMDGAQYVLRGHAMHANGEIRDFEIESNVGTPLAQWVDSMVAALQRCWTPAPRP